MAVSVKTPNIQQIARDIQQQYVEAMQRSDVDALVSLFTDDAVFMPVTGGIYRGREEIRRFFEEQRSDGSSMRIDSMQLDDLGDDVLFNLGTFVGSVRTEEGEQQVEAEYVALVKREREAFKIYRLVSFMRGLPGQPEG